MNHGLALLILLLIAATACHSSPSKQVPIEHQAQVEPREPRIPAIDAEGLISAVVDYYQTLPGDAHRRLHHIELHREQLADFVPLFASADPVADDRLSFITTTNGTLTTESGAYRFQIGQEKIGRRTYRCSLYPIGDPAGRAQYHYRWTREQGRVVEAEVQAALAANADRAILVQRSWWSR